MTGAIVVGALAATGSWYMSRRPSAPPTVTRFVFTLPDGQALTGATRRMVAISPDGERMVYSANDRLYLRSMSQLESKPIQGTDGDSREPVFSPDGRSVAFYSVSEETLKRVALTGGAPVMIARVDNPNGLTWGPDSILFGVGNKGIMRVSPNGGTPDVLVRVKDDEVADGPQLLPGGQHVMFTLARGIDSDRWSKAQVIVQSLASGQRTTIIEGGSDARYLPTGHLVYALSGQVFAVAFDVQRLKKTGDPVLIIDGVRRATGSGAGPRITGATSLQSAGFGAADFSVSETGSLVYVPGPVIAAGSAPPQIALMDRKGVVEPLKLQPAQFAMPRLSPDGKRITFGTDDGKEAIVWIYDLAGATAMRRVTFGGHNRFPIWSSDGRRVAFQSDRDGDLAVFSPDGRWLAYSSTTGGKTTIYVEPFPATGAKYQMIAKGTDSPKHARWSANGRELFINPSPTRFEAVSVTTRPTFAFGGVMELPKLLQGGPAGTRTPYDVTPDGKFVGLITAGSTQFAGGSTNQVQVVLNWTEELKRLVPAN